MVVWEINTILRSNQTIEESIMEKPKKRNRNGKGSAYRVPVGDKQYKYNYDRIFKKKDK